MKWSYAEMGITDPPGMGLEWSLNDVGDCIDKLTEMSGYPEPEKGDNGRMITAAPESIALPADVVIGDARMLDQDDDSVDAIIFDPPYHNNVNYAELSDFFYVWLKRTAGYVLNDTGGLFAEHLTDKVNEAIASPAVSSLTADARQNGKTKTSAAQLATDDYQRKMDEIFRECHRVLKKDHGIMTVMFTHKSNDAWNAMTIGLIGSRLQHHPRLAGENRSRILHEHPRQSRRPFHHSAGLPPGRATPPPALARRRPRNRPSGADDVENLLSYDLKTVDIYTASYGTALKVISENWGARRNTANPDRPDKPFDVLPEDALAVARQEIINFRSKQIAQDQAPNLSDPLTWFYILSQDGAGSATIPFDEANMFARALGVELSGNEAKRILSSKNGKITLKAAAERWSERIISAEQPAVTPLDQAHTAIAIAGRQDAAAARQWLEFNGHRWQEGEFKTTFNALRQIHKPGHPDEAGMRALHALLYEEEQPHQERLIGSAAAS